MEYLLVGTVLISVLIQGGFYPTCFLFMGVILSVLCLRIRRRPLTAEYLLWSLVAVYLISSLTHGFDSRCLSQALLAGSAALFLYVYCDLSPKKKQALLETLLAGSTVFAALSNLSFSGLLPLQGAVVSHRLQFTFQYANAAGSWFAATALLVQDTDAKKLRLFAPLSITALLLTGSIGAIGLYFLLLAVKLWLTRDSQTWSEALFTQLTAVAFALLFHRFEGLTAVPLLALLCLAGRVIHKIPWVRWKLLLPVCAIPVATLSAAVLSGRLLSGARTMAERLIQIIDGANVIVHNPLLGIGAGNWAEVYPYYQSAQYNSAVVHSSLIQIGVDAGIPAMVLSVIFILLAWRTGKRSLTQGLAALLLIVHSTVDFTLRFYPIVLLLLVLLFWGDCEGGTKKQGFSSFMITATITLALCVGLSYSEIQYKRCVYQSQTQNWRAVIVSYERNKTLFGRNTLAENLYLNALYASGQPRQALKTMNASKNLTLDALILKASILHALGNHDEACQFLLSELVKQPYCVSLYEQTAELFSVWGADEKYISRFNAIADDVNRNQGFLAAFKGDHVPIGHIHG